MTLVHRSPRRAGRRWAVLALLSLAFSLALATAAQAAPVPRSAPASASIIGGQAAPAGHDPWLAFIEHVGESGAYTCTGSVIAPRLVLTAGHCILTEGGGLATASGYTISTGSNDVLTATQVSHVTQRLLFPAYVPAESLGDAGLLVLSSPVAAPPLPLANASDGALLKQGTDVEVAGWGLTNGKATQTPTSLRRADMTLQSVAYCTAQSAAYLTVYDPSRQICAIEPPQFTTATCHGDSGGPVIADRANGSAVEVGVIDLGDPECSAELPNVFVRADLISPWAEAWIDAVELGAPPPKIVVPTLTVPRLDVSDAKQLARLALGDDEVFGPRFERGKQVAFQCRRLAKAKVSCGVSWHQGADDFYGRIVVYIAKYASGEGLFAASSYTINFVNDHCQQTQPECNVTTVTS
ncbi:MAG TPA: serine protease [Solirubrobacterales bacterium]|jgi:secreted trypsin-like serine protease